MTIHMPPSRAPRPQDIDYIAKVTCAKAWNVVDGTWQCSCCKRSKLDTVRLSNKNQLTYNIFRPQFFEEPGRYDEKALVCQDCAKIATGIGREGCLALGIENENAYAQFLTADELTLAVLPARHRQHNISNNHAYELIKIVIGRIEAKQHITARNAAIAKDGDEI